MKLALGTVQFGLDYGISNKSGKTPADEVYKILSTAGEAGLNLLDTAPSYGASEAVIGDTIKKLEEDGIRRDFKIVSKFTDYETFHTTLKRLKQERLYALLFHNCDDLLKAEGERILKEILKFKEQGKVQKIGVSIYEEAQMEKALEKFGDGIIDVVQLPINVFDQRLIKSGLLQRLKERNIEIHARSVFLQGLLLTPAKDADKKFEKSFDLLRGYQQYLKEKNITLIEGALSFVKNISQIDKIIIGVNNQTQLIANIAAYKKDTQLDMSRFDSGDAFLIDPRKW